MANTIALVTGANQGIGFEIAKKLATEQKDYHVIMAGRRKEAIEEAAQKLKHMGLSVEPLVLDVKSDASIETAASSVTDKHGRLDVLINNAAIATAPTSADGKPSTPREELLQILNTNVAGIQGVTDAFIPLLEKATGTKRIVFISSGLGSLTYKADPSHLSRKTPWRPYTISKTAENMLALFYAAQFDERDDWKVNISCPGYCATNLNSYAGSNPPEHGAINACRLATLGPDGETNTFTNKDGITPW
ncbi:hypothetical protein N0V82_004611 [Gnomoniopsis sp. IMI 355080]|nr:hypothetical protein N0V82_004611 [Gnomoniopsis sp. IMI 355080]